MRKYFLVLCCLLTMTAQAQVDYLERSWDAERKQVITQKRTCNTFKEITGNLANIRDTYGSGWYVIKGDVARFQMYFKGEVHLILTDGCKVRVKGIVVHKHENTKLYIYSQSDGENQGKIEAINDYFDLNAAIGGVEKSSMGSLYIHGGDISATQNKVSPAAIGGGAEGQIDPQSEIVVYGGKVTAKAALMAAIGAGYARDQGGPVTIYGGVVDATGGSSGAGIGGAHNGSGGRVNVYGGKVTARGQDSKNSCAGIGGFNGGDVHVYGGEVYAYGGGWAAGIGGAGGANGYSAAGNGGTLEVTGGLVFASCNQHDEWQAPAIGGGQGGDAGKVTITGGTVMAVTRQDNKYAPAPIGAGSYYGGHLYYSKGELHLGDNMKVSYSAHQDAIKDAKYREGIYLHTVSAAQREDACTNHTYTFVKIEACSHPQFTYICKDDAKHVRQCTLCNNKVEEAHAYPDGQVCACGRLNADNSDFWTVKYCYSKDGKTYDQSEDYQVIKGMDFSLPAPPDIEGLSFMGYLPILSSTPSGIEMKDSEQERGELMAAGTTITPSMNTTLYARYRCHYTENWEWSDDLTTATVTVTNTKTGDTKKLNATITEEEQERVEPTEESLGEAHFTAVATYTKAQGVTYHFEDRAKATLFKPKSIILDALDTDGGNTALLEKYYGFHAEVTINHLTLKKDGKLHTICLPFSLTDLKDTPLEGATLYKYLGYSKDSDKMTLQFSRTTGVEAGIPCFYLFKNEGTEVSHPTFPVVVIDDFDGSGNYEDGFDMVGTYQTFGFVDEERDNIVVFNANEIVHNVETVDAFSGYFYIVPSFGEQGNRTVRTLSLEFDKSDGLVFTKRLFDSWTGEGTAASPYMIMRGVQLVELQETMSSADASRLKGKYFKQGANITFDKTTVNNFTPITNFKAHYDGAGYIISGLNISQTDYQNATLFRTLDEGASVKNVIVQNSSFKGYSAAAIASTVLGGAHVENCHVLKDVIIESETNAGGVVGAVNDEASLVTGCSSHATVKGIASVGGIVGMLTTGVVSNSIYLGNSITANAEYHAVVGARQGGKVENCYFTAPTLSDPRAKLMPQYNKDVDNTDFLTRLAARDKFLTGTSGLTKGQIGYDITLNNRATLSAVQNADGTWKSKAFSVSLPFWVKIKEQFAADVPDITDYVMAYHPYRIDLDKKELIFTHIYPEIAPGEAYVILVKKGSIALTGKNVTIVDVPSEPSKVMSAADENTQIGEWKGTFKTIDNDEMIAENNYIGQRGRKFQCQLKGKTGSWTSPFVGYFSSLEELGCDVFKMKFVYTEQGAGDEGEVTDFPADEFDSDFEFDDVETGISTINRHADSHDRYYDLQGRQVIGQPSKGVYIKNGKVVIVK